MSETLNAQGTTMAVVTVSTALQLIVAELAASGNINNARLLQKFDALIKDPDFSDQLAPPLLEYISHPLRKASHG